MKRIALNATTYTIDLEDEILPIIIRRHASSRRLVIRYQPLQHALTLTLPRYVSIKQGLKFIEEKREWIKRQVQATPRQVPFAEGQVIPVLGAQYLLVHSGKLRGTTYEDDRKLIVSGDPGSMPRRVREWLIARTSDYITQYAKANAATLAVSINSVSLRDTASRWGSCNNTGDLSFSWRLGFAPLEILEYVVSHEVAHLKELNHSPAFWALVARLDPAWKAHRAWLRKHGASLYVYG